MASVSNDVLRFDYCKLDPKGHAPTKDEGDIGWDLRCIADINFRALYAGYLGTRIKKGGLCYELPPGERHVFHTGIAIELPQHRWAKFEPRSGLAVKHGIDVLAGVIDNSYRGELMVCLINHGKDTVHINEGDKICQMIVVKEVEGLFNLVDKLSDTERGNKGFGSSGR